MQGERAALRIGEVARRTGVGVATLRAWERRYDLLQPTRTDGGHRRYSDADVDRVRAVQVLIDDGWAVGAAAEAVRSAPSVLATGAPSAGDAGRGDAQRLQAALGAFDETAAEAVLDDVFARSDAAVALDEVVLPTIRWIGIGWEQDDHVVAREHLATNVLRPRLQRLLRTSPTPTGQLVVAAAPELEEHDLGLLAASVVAAAGGWRVHFLGARAPTRVLERAVSELRPAVVLVGGVSRDHALTFLDDPPRLAGVPVVLGGPAFRREDADRLPYAVVHEGAIRAVLPSIRRARALVEP